MRILLTEVEVGRNGLLLMMGARVGPGSMGEQMGAALMEAGLGPALGDDVCRGWDCVSDGGGGCGGGGVVRGWILSPGTSMVCPSLDSQRTSCPSSPCSRDLSLYLAGSSRRTALPTICRFSISSQDRL